MRDTAGVQKAICKHLILSGHESVCENIAAGFNEMDVCSITKNGMLYEIEVKVSRSDFHADKKKEKWRWLALKPENGPNYFYYACPEGMIKEAEVPAFAGLLYVDATGAVTVMKRPRRLHPSPRQRERILHAMTRLHAQRLYLGCALMTYKNRETAEEWERKKAEREADSY